MPEMTFGQMREAAAGQGFEPHPIGEYLFKVESAEIKPGTKSPSSQIMIRLVNQNGPHANKSVLNRLSPFKNDGEVNGMFFQQLQALGFSDQDPIWAQLDQYGVEQGLQMLTPQLPGRMCIAVITHQMWNGETRDNVKRMKPYTGSAPGAPLAPPAPNVGGAVPSAPPSPQPLQAVPGQGAPAAPPTPYVPAPPPAPAPMPVTGPEQVPVTVTEPVTALPVPTVPTPPLPQAPTPPQPMQAVTTPYVPTPPSEDPFSTQ